jgi:hypothetical protein
MKYAVNMGSGVTCVSDSRRGFGLDIGFIDHFNTQLVITLLCLLISILYESLFHSHTHTHTSVLSVTSRFLVKASNKGYSSDSGPKFCLNCGSLPTELSQSYFTTGCLPPLSSSWRQAP